MKGRDELHCESGVLESVTVSVSGLSTVLGVAECVAWCVVSRGGRTIRYGRARRARPKRKFESKGKMLKVELDLGSKLLKVPAGAKC